VPPLPIIEHLDVFKDILLRVLSRGIAPMIDSLRLRAGEKWSGVLIPCVPREGHPAPFVFPGGWTCDTVRRGLRQRFVGAWARLPFSAALSVANSARRINQTVLNSF